jgi:hypothetical protein
MGKKKAGAKQTANRASKAPKPTSPPLNQNKSSSRVKIGILSESELRQYAYEVTVKNEEYKQKLKVAHEMFVKLQDAYKRLKQATSRKEERAGAIESSDAPRKCVQELPEKPRKIEMVPDSQEKTPSKSNITASQLSGGIPSNVQLALLSEDETPGLVGCSHNMIGTETPKDTTVKRNRQNNFGKSPAWETIEKKKRLDKLHLGHEIVPDPDDPVRGLFPDRHIEEDRAFKYLEVVRKQDERAKLPAGFCAECARFYRIYAKHGDLEQANALARRMCGHTVHQETSRHRQKWQAPASPEDFWHLAPPEPHT